MRSCSLRIFLSLLFALLASTATTAAEPATPRELVDKSKRILFLGDSITAGGHYVACFDAWLYAQKLPHKPLVINAGLPSETVSGLSEEGHAGGKFPRPDLAERLDRVLEATKPDLIFACYGINCGIYEPFDAGRFDKYQAGMKNLREHAAKVGAQVVHITPPFYDDMRAPKKGFSYNEVLDRYSAWLLEQRTQGWTVIDLHGPMTQEVKRRRETDPKFTFQGDGVHPNNDGQWFIAQQLLRALGDEKAAHAATPAEMLALSHTPADVLQLSEQHMGTLRDAYVGAAGHKRPGVAKGLPIAEADKKAAELDEKITAILRDTRK